MRYPIVWFLFLSISFLESSFAWSAPFLLQFGPFSGSAASFVNANERIDGATVENNVQPFGGVTIDSAELILSMDFSEVTIRSIDVSVSSAPIVISDTLDHGFLGQLPYKTTFSNIMIDVVPQDMVASLSISGGFLTTLPATYSWDADLEINGTTTTTHVVDNGFFDIEVGDLDPSLGLTSITLKIAGDSQGERVIYKHTLPGDIIIELRHIVFLDRYSFSATTVPEPISPVPEPATWVMTATGLAILAGHTYCRKRGA